jgi:C4-dicarboxylate-specific signal transduction histidine kinase
MSGRLAGARVAAALPQELRALLDALPMPAMLVAADGALLHANAEAAAHPPPGEGAALFVPGIGECRLVVAPPAPSAQTQRLASLGFMVAGVCHDVSNPLAAVSSMVQILQSKRGVSAETLTKGLASISSNIARVLAITKKLGDFSRVTGEVPTALEIDDAVEAAASLLRHSPSGESVAFRYAGAPGARVLARPSELQQVIFNVLLNAAQAMQGAGCIEAAARLEGARVVLSVRDQGPGIPPEHLPRLFDPFFTTKQPGEGTGLGLAISYEIVHELGGSMRAANHPQGGACFEVALPASAPP